MLRIYFCFFSYNLEYWTAIFLNSRIFRFLGYILVRKVYWDNIEIWFLVPQFLPALQAIRTSFMLYEKKEGTMCFLKTVPWVTPIFTLPNQTNQYFCLLEVKKYKLFFFSISKHNNYPILILLRLGSKMQVFSNIDGPTFHWRHSS